jgi:hypothetical protein
MMKVVVRPKMCMGVLHYHGWAILAISKLTAKDI